MWLNHTRFVSAFGRAATAVTRTYPRGISGQNDANSIFCVSPEVSQALEQGLPVVALESTIISHGMPWPSNLETAIAVESVVREQGAIPATVAILSGRITVGLSLEKLETLAKPREKLSPIKVSRRDIPYALSNSLDGGTTVAGTMIAANMAGIPIFATGGIGGVHRGGENSMDISADLLELGRTPVSVICAGVKSILDIERTLEYLETQGVPVAVLGESDLFPAFYARSHSGLKAPQHLKTAVQAAKLIAMSRKAGLSNGSLIAVPVPEEFAMNENEMDNAISTALKTAFNNGVRGKHVTPFLLQAIKEITQGRSLETNIALIKNNAKVAAEIAVELVNLEKSEKHFSSNQVKKCKQNIIYHDQKRKQHTLSPVVVGGSVADVYIKVLDSEIKLDGSTLSCASSAVSGGGVARNIAEAMHKLGAAPKLISAIGRDANGQFLDSLLPKDCTRTVARPLTGSTASCTIILDITGECKLFLGDMKMHDAITVDLVKQHENAVKDAQLIVIDSNIPLNTMQYVLKKAHHCGKPVLYEPTDMRKANRILEFPLPEPLAICTPNIAELRAMASMVLGNVVVENAKNAGCVMTELKTLCTALIYENIVEVLVVTLGDKGVAIARRKGNSEKIFGDNGVYLRNENKSKTNISVRLYPPAQLPPTVTLANTSGAGDCFAAGFAVAAMHGFAISAAVQAGTIAAAQSLVSNVPIPDKLFDLSDEQEWKKDAKFEEL